MHALSLLHPFLADFMLDFRVACVVAVAALTCSSIFTVLVFMHTGFYLFDFLSKNQIFSNTSCLSFSPMIQPGEFNVRSRLEVSVKHCLWDLLLEP